MVADALGRGSLAAAAQFLTTLAVRPAVLMAVGADRRETSALWQATARQARERGYTVIDLGARDRPRADLTRRWLALPADAPAAATATARRALVTLHRLSERGPVIVGVDDWEHADAAIQRGVAMIARRLPPRAGLLIAAAGTPTEPALADDDLGPDVSRWLVTVPARRGRASAPTRAPVAAAGEPAAATATAAALLDRAAATGLARGDVAAGLQLARAAANVADRHDCGRARLRSRALEAALLALGGRPDAGSRLARAQLLGARDPHDAVAVAAGALMGLWHGDAPAASAQLTSALARDPAGLDATRLRLALAWVELALGRPGRVVALVRESGPSSGWPALLAGSLHAAALTLAGPCPGARESASAAVHAARAAGCLIPEALALTALARLDLHDGRGAHAAAPLLTLHRRALAAGVTAPGVLRLAPELIECLLAAGDRPAAARELERLRRTARTGHPWAAAAALRAEGQLRAADGSSAVAQAAFAAAAEAFDAIGHGFDAARALTDLAQLHVQCQHRRRADDAAGRAVERWHALGAHGWAAHTRAGIASGEDASALTPSERRIAELVIAGASNKRAAAETRTTVTAIEAHLSRLYRKLGICSRGQLAALSAAGGLRDGARDALAG